MQGAGGDGHGSDAPGIATDERGEAGEPDGGVPDGTTFVISAFTFDGYSLSDFTNHWHNG